MALNDYVDWSIPDLFDELISYCAGNIEDDTTEAIKAAIASKARSEGVVEGAEQMKEKIRAISPLIDKGSDNYHTPFYLVDVDVLAPKSVVHTKILYPPASVLAPTKEVAG